MKSARRARAIRGSRASNSPPAKRRGWDDEKRRVSCGSKGKTAADRGGCRCFNTPPTQGCGRVKRPGRPGDGDAKTAADRMARQGDFAFVHTSNALSTQGHRRARRPGHPSDGSAKTAADREACQGGLGLSALQAPVPEETPAGGQNVSRFAGQNAKTAAGRTARQGDLGSVHASKAPPPEWRRGLCAVVPQPMQAYTSKLSCTSAAVRGISKAVEPPAGIASHQALSPERSAPSPSR